jgi:DNA repair photolyase
MQKRESSICQQKAGFSGRGALENPSGRFEKYDLIEEYDQEFPESDAHSEKVLKTQIYHDTSRSIVSYNDSPDLGMEASVNPYRGCEHGCIYCYARPYHEYLGLSAGLDFETKIFAKPDAPQLLRKKLESRNWEPVTLVMSGVTDPYQPLEAKMKITRGCLEVLREFINPVAIITKNHLVTRDIDILSDLSRYKAAAVNVSITTLEKDLARRMEPRASTPEKRLAAIEALSRAGIPVNLMMGPVLPGLTEHEIPALLERAANAGARSAAYTILRLPHGVKDLFQSWLHEHFPDRVQKILNRIKDIRGGKLNDPEFGSRMRGQGIYADQIHSIFAYAKKRYKLDQRIGITSEFFRRPSPEKGPQLELQV